MKKFYTVLIGLAIYGAIYFVNYIYQKEQVKAAIENATAKAITPMNHH
jgi:hypothetical protein